MGHIEYHQASDGSHHITISSEFNMPEIQELMDVLQEIARTNPDKATYIIIDLRGQYVLPLREFASPLKRFYQNLPENQAIFMALLVDTAVVSVLSTIIKTLIKRDSIQYFTQDDKAHLWLTIERGKQQKKSSEPQAHHN